MKRRNLPKFKSLVDLLGNNNPVKRFSRDQRVKAHLKNLLNRRYDSGKYYLGSGYLRTKDGYFITNNHVLPDEEGEVHINKIDFPFRV